MTLLNNRMVMLAMLLCVEILAIAVAYQFFASIECQATEAEGACRLLRSVVARAVSVFAALTLFVWARPMAVAGLMRRVQGNPNGQSWMLLHFAGVAVMFAPLLMARSGDVGAIFAVSLVPWLIGAIAATAGAVFWLAPARDWWEWLREERFLPLIVAGVAFVIPDFANLILPAWDWPALTSATFAAVDLTLRIFGANPVSQPEAYVIGIDGFAVHIARQCSGVEGFALVTGFTLLYGFLFRDQLRFPRFWFVMIPAGLILSWCLNVLRIAALIGIGAHISPEIAVNGFHSYAGWLFFTLLALAILYGAQTIPYLQRKDTEPRLRPLREDWVAARIVPFVVFMLASVTVSALSTHPDLGYPLKTVAMMAVIAYFSRCYRHLSFSLDPVAVVVGIGVGLAWVMLEPGTDEPDMLGPVLAQLGGLVFLLWAVSRLVGTILLVPLIEELFFRGYVLTRIDTGSTASRLLAIGVSSALFATLHGRWLAAGLAGIVFALVLLRRGRLIDAVVAHGIANLIVAAWAVWIGRWDLI